MIIEFFINSAFGVVTWVLSSIGYVVDTGSLGSWALNGYALIQAASSFVPLDIVVFCIGNIVMWLGIQFAISAIRFVLDFIPFF